MAESISREELTCCEEDGKKKNLLLTAKHLKSHQAFGLFVIIFLKLMAKRLRNVALFTLIINTIVKY